MERRRWLLAVGIACALGLTLIGCADELNGDARGSAVGGGSQEVTGDSSASTETPKDADVAPAKVAPKDCLKGEWVADNAFFLAGMREFGDEPQSVTGEVIITYRDDGTMMTEYQDWLITFLVEGGTTLISRTGVDSGAFMATADTVSIEDTHVGSTMTVSMSGMVMPVDPNPINYADVPYTCSATNASLTTVDGEMRMTRR